MEASIKEQLGLMADKLENFLFPDNNPQTQDQTQYFQSFFTESYVFPVNLLKYMRQEISLGFVFNIILFGILVAYLPFNFYYCWECNSVMTLWLLYLCILNAALIIPKVLLIRKLFRIEDCTDIYQANYSLWMFSRSPVYKFNIMMSKYVFTTYLVGTVLLIISWASNKNCDRYYGMIGLLLGSFVARVVSSFFKFLQSFNNPQTAESFHELFNGSTTAEISSLSVMSHKQYCTLYGKSEDICPICYENYTETQEVRIMECPGDHAFHKKCIDKWLLKSNKCPKCNLNIFYKRQNDGKSE
jgi:RING-finger-containing ubiquitin ligase